MINPSEKPTNITRYGSVHMREERPPTNCGQSPNEDSVFDAEPTLCAEDYFDDSRNLDDPSGLLPHQEDWWERS